jgi:hypothetical protein
MREAVGCAINGQESSITDRQLPWFLGPIGEIADFGDLTAERIQWIVLSKNAGHVSFPVRVLWYRILKIVRKIAATVSARAS